MYMATNARTKKAKKSPLPWKRLGIVSGIVLAGLVLMAQLAYDVRSYLGNRADDDNIFISTLIVQSLRSINKPAVLEPISKKVYLPDADLVLPPAPKTASDLLYSYVPSTDGSDAEANVTSTNALNVGISQLLSRAAEVRYRRDPNAFFSNVPNAQACARGVHVVFGDKTTYDHLKFSKTLSDGRTMQVYTEAKPCAYNLDALVDYLRDAESY
jgi:hypothetical protein